MFIFIDAVRQSIFKVVYIKVFLHKHNEVQLRHWKGSFSNFMLICEKELLKLWVPFPVKQLWSIKLNVNEAKNNLML